MKRSVTEAFFKFSTQLEGYVPHMYLDIKGLVTVGIGNLIDPMTMALNLPFVYIGSLRPATRNDIIYEWRKMKLNKQLAKQGHLAAKKLATLILTDKEIANLVSSKMISFERELKKTFNDFDQFPADAQLGIMSMTWAIGSGFTVKFPKFTAAVKRQDWNEAAEQCYINSTNNPGLVPRNKINRKLFLAAAYVSYENLNPNIIYGLQSIDSNRTDSTA